MSVLFWTDLRPISAKLGSNPRHESRWYYMMNMP